MVSRWSNKFSVIRSSKDPKRGRAIIMWSIQQPFQNLGNVQAKTLIFCNLSSPVTTVTCSRETTGNQCHLLKRHTTLLKIAWTRADSPLLLLLPSSSKSPTLKGKLQGQWTYHKLRLFGSSMVKLFRYTVLPRGPVAPTKILDYITKLSSIYHQNSGLQPEHFYPFFSSEIGAVYFTV